MNILIPVLSFEKGGGPRVLSKLADEFLLKGHDVIFLCSKYSNTPYFPTKAKIKYVNIWGKESKKSEQNIHFLIKLICISFGLVAFKKSMDLIIANFCFTAFPIAFSRSRAKKVYYIQAYEPEFTFSRILVINKLFQFIAKLSYKLPLSHIINSNLYYSYNDLKPIGVVYPGLDLATYFPKDIPSSNSDEDFIVGCIGRHEEWKGTDDVVRAVELLNKSHNSVKLLIAYNSTKYLNTLDINYELVIPENDTELADYYRRVDVLVAPGTIQLGAVHYPVIESMACNTPVITTGYYPATDTNSWLVPIKSPKNISLSIKEIMKNKKLVAAKTKNALLDVKDFEWEVCANKFIDIVNKI